MKLSRDKITELLFQTDPYEFEELVAALMEEWGWETSVTPGSNDRGIDITVNKASPFNQKYAIQVKQNSSENKISSPAVQQYSSIQRQNKDVDGVVIITTSSFTSNAEEMAFDLGVKLIDNDDLVDLFADSKGKATLKEYFDLTENGDRAQQTSDDSSVQEPIENPERYRAFSPVQEPIGNPEIHRAFDAICAQYQENLSRPTELKNMSCPECSGNIYESKFTDSSNYGIRFCIACGTIFKRRGSGWKSRDIHR
jgi:hypothetical protein